MLRRRSVYRIEVRNPYRAFRLVLLGSARNNFSILADFRCGHTFLRNKVWLSARLLLDSCVAQQKLPSCALAAAQDRRNLFRCADQSACSPYSNQQSTASNTGCRNARLLIEKPSPTLNSSSSFLTCSATEQQTNFPITFLIIHFLLGPWNFNVFLHLSRAKHHMTRFSA